MGCGSSTPQQEEATGDSSSKTLRLSRLIRRRGGVDSIRGRRKIGVRDPVTTVVDHPSPSPSPADYHHHHSHKMSSRRGNVVVVEAVWRGVEEEEGEYDGVLNNNNDTISKTKDVRKMYVPEHFPSFNVYCARVDSFDTNSSSTKDTDNNYDVDVKTMHGSHKSMDTTASVKSSDEEEKESIKSKVEVQKGREMTKKTAWNWRLASPLGMKNLLFVMSSCYSSSPHNRHTLVSRG